jgi:hypothetical protein
VSATNFNLTQRQRHDLSGISGLIFWITTVSLLPVAALIGGMAFVLIALAVCLAVIVYKRPQEAPGAGMLYLFGSSILLPYGSRIDFTLPATEMYFWAAGLLIITCAAIARLGLRLVFTVPRSAQVFLVVGAAAAVYGLTHGATTSYVFRQFYGVLLLIIYFGIALHAGDEELLLRRIQTFGLLCACCFFAYYIAVFADYGFHKEMGFNGTQASLLAIVLFIYGMERRKGSWVLGGITLLFVPALIFMRKDLVTFLVAVIAALAMTLKSKVLRFLCCSAIVLIAIPAIFPPITEMVAEELLKIPVIGVIIPEGSQDASTLYDRTVQLAEAAITVQAHPWLGAGLGSEFEFESAALGFEQTYYVDNGWAYLLQKMGLLGMAAFLWFLTVTIRNVSRKSLAFSACLLAASLVTMFSQPVFLHFTTAPFFGSFAGLLLAKKIRQSTQKVIHAPV